MTTLPTVDFVTCKLIFPYGTITREGIEQLLSKHTKNFEIANFYPDREVGCNRISFAVVDVPQKVIQNLLKEPSIKEIDPMNTHSKPVKHHECCGPIG